jgi:transposase-like protein
MDGTITMSKNEQFQLRIIEDYRAGRITRREASVLIGLSEKSVQRIAKKVRIQGAQGVKHGNTACRAHNKVSGALEEAMLLLASKTYGDFNMTHCYERLTAIHGLTVSYSTFRSWCRKAGIGKRKRRRASKRRVYRERLANEGLMLQMDGSHHKWNGEDEWVLIAAIDDATSDIPHAEFFRSEDTLNCMTVLRRIIEIRGIPECLYVDHAGWFGGLKRQFFSQFVRACDELGVRVIYANSPEAKGRIERTWQTFQDRLIPELRINGIKAMGAANEYLQRQFIPKYWQERNTVVARDPQSRYRQLDHAVKLDDIFCMKYERKVRRDHTVSFDNKSYRLQGQWVGSLHNKDISIAEGPSGRLRAFYGHLQLDLKEIVRPGKRQLPARWSKKSA